MINCKYFEISDHDPNDISYRLGICLKWLRKTITTIDRAFSVVVDIPTRRLPDWIVDRYLWAGLRNAVFEDSTCRLLLDINIFKPQRLWWRYIALRISKFCLVRLPKFAMQDYNFVAMYDRNMADILTIGFNQWRYLLPHCKLTASTYQVQSHKVTVINNM